MVLIYGIFEIMATFIESYFSFKFNDLFVIPNIEKKNALFLSVILTLVISIINSFNLFSLLTLIVALLFISAMNYRLFKVPFFDTFSITAFYSFLIVLIDFFSMSVIGFLLDNHKFASEVVAVTSEYRCVFLLLSKTILVTAYCIVKKLLIHLNKLKSRNLLLITVLGYIGVCYYAKFTFEHINLSVIVNWFALFIIVVLSLFSLSAYICYQKLADEKRLVEVRNHTIANGYMELTKYYQENAQLYHDMKHHILVLQQLFEGKKYYEAEKYLNTLSEVTAIIECTWTGNPIMDCILNNKKMVCEQMKINIIIDADPIEVELDGVMISTILSNLMDNAIEACQKFRDEIPCIKVAIRHINDMIFIKIQNPVIELPVTENGVIITLKANKDRQHGWGLKSVEDIVKKAGGVFRYSYKERKFVSVVTLFL